jgi:hypothetical protein
MGVSFTQIYLQKHREKQQGSKDQRVYGFAFFHFFLSSSLSSHFMAYLYLKKTRKSTGSDSELSG